MRENTADLRSVYCNSVTTCNSKSGLIYYKFVNSYHCLKLVVGSGVNEERKSQRTSSMTDSVQVVSFYEHFYEQTIIGFFLWFFIYTTLAIQPGGIQKAKLYRIISQRG